MFCFLPVCLSLSSHFYVHNIFWIFKYLIQDSIHRYGSPRKDLQESLVLFKTIFIKEEVREIAGVYGLLSSNAILAR